MINIGKIYKDPKRKIGSQSEIPSLIYKNNNIIVNSYQKFIINEKTKKIEYISKHKKFNYIDNLFKKLNKQNNCNSIVDIGCNSGLVSIIALNNEFINIQSLDHDPQYISILHSIKKNVVFKK